MSEAYKILCDELNYLVEKQEVCKQSHFNQDKYDKQIEHLRIAVAHLKVAMAEKDSRK